PQVHEPDAVLAVRRHAAGLCSLYPPVQMWRSATPASTPETALSTAPSGGDVEANRPDGDHQYERTHGKERSGGAQETRHDQCPPVGWALCSRFVLASSRHSSGSWWILKSQGFRAT